MRQRRAFHASLQIARGSLFRPRRRPPARQHNVAFDQEVGAVVGTDASDFAILHCPECQIRFYGLGREAIVCPSRVAPYTPTPRHVADPGVRATPFWRKHKLAREERQATKADARVIGGSSLSGGYHAGRRTRVGHRARSDTDLVLEQEPEEGDVSGLVDRDTDDAKET
jgi:hypothetical protein